MDYANRTESATPRKGLDSFVLKIVAIVAMTCNHTANIFSADLPFGLLCILYGLGGLTFPIMAFLLVEGYRHTSNVKKYAMRLLVFASLSQIPYWLFLFHQGNVLFTLFLGLSVLYLYDRLKNRLVFMAVFLLSVFLGSFLDWGSVGVAMILAFYVLKGRYARIIVPVTLPLALYVLARLSLTVPTSVFSRSSLLQLIYVVVGVVIVVPLLLAYNGRRGYPLKYFFYAYYPAHILVLGLIQSIFFSG